MVKRFVSSELSGAVISSLHPIDFFFGISGLRGEYARSTLCLQGKSDLPGEDRNHQITLDTASTTNNNNKHGTNG
jgi:hypothetical protein